MREGARLYVREAPRLIVDPFSKSTTNEVIFIIEERLVVAAIRPEALVKVTFADES